MMEPIVAPRSFSLKVHSLDEFLAPLPSEQFGFVKTLW